MGTLAQVQVFQDKDYAEALAVVETAEETLKRVHSGVDQYAQTVVGDHKRGRKIIAEAPAYKAGHKAATEVLKNNRPVIPEQAREVAATVMEQFKRQYSNEQNTIMKLRWRGAQAAIEEWRKDWIERIDIRDRLTEYKARLKSISFAGPEVVMAERLDQAIAEGNRGKAIDLSLAYLTPYENTATNAHTRALQNLQSIIKDVRFAGFDVREGVATLATRREVETETLAMRERL